MWSSFGLILFIANMFIYRAWWYMFANMSKTAGHWNVGKVSLFNVIGVSATGEQQSGVQDPPKLGFVDSVYHFIGFHATHFAVLYWIFRRMVLTLVRFDLSIGAMTSSPPSSLPSNVFSFAREITNGEPRAHYQSKTQAEPSNSVVVKRIRLNRQED
jgi:hypothetical protein